MISINNSVYIDIPKTASSYVCTAIAEMFDYSMIEDIHPTRHHIMRSFPNTTKTLVFASIRNPFSYYRSMWEHVYSEHDGIWGSFDNFILWKNELNPNDILRDGSSHGTDTMCKVECFNNFKHSGLGHLTYKLIQHLDYGFLKQPRTADEVEDWFERTWFSGDKNLIIIGIHDIKAELLDLLDKRRDMFPKIDDYDIRLEALKYRKTNVMKDNIMNFDQTLPTPEQCEMIAEKERVLIKRFRFTTNVPMAYLEDM